MKIVFGKEKTDLNVVFINGAEDKVPEKFKYSGFEGKKGQIELIKKTVYVGTSGIKESDDWREIGHSVSSFLIGTKAETAKIEVPENSREFLEGLYLGTYSFKKYKSEKKDPSLKTIFVFGPGNVKETMKTVKIITDSQCLVRDLVNTSPDDAHSETIAQIVTSTFKDSAVRVTVYGESSLQYFGMNGHLAVNRASRHEAKTIKLEYSPENFKKHIVLVGKGLTYDSGGLSLKPSISMTTMKMDKAGAMTVFGIMNTLKELKPDTKVTAYMCLAENMVGGDAYKPDDVLTMKNGKTVHVKNTDAEGRIVLFDNICLAEEENPNFDELYTFATLTGAAVAAFGNETCAMVGFNDDMKQLIKIAGKESGELFTNAEFNKYMLNGVDDSLADLSNTGTATQGCQKAGLFLTKALKEENQKKYLHLDIAGPAYAEKPWGTNKEGGTGFAVRTFAKYILG